MDNLKYISNTIVNILSKYNKIEVNNINTDINISNKNALLLEEIRSPSNCNLLNKENIIDPIIPDSDTDNKLNFFIKCIFHELRNPLNNIVLGIDSLLREEKDKEKNSILKIVKNNCKSLNLTLNSFLLINNTTTNNSYLILNKQPFNIIGLLNKIEYLIYFNITEKQIKIKYIMKQLFNNWLIGDPVKLEQALLNLLLNIINNSILSSIITIEILNIKNKIQINIIDQNNHIPDNIKNKLFQETSPTNDIELDLYLTKKIINLHDGEIFYEAIYPLGNKFSIMLDLKYCKNISHILLKQNISEEKSISEKKSISENIKIISREISNSIYILIVDDSETTRKMLNKILSKNILDLYIFEAIDGLESIKIVHEHIDNINIILMDNIMPNIIGPLATKIIRKMGFKNLIIGITGNGSKDDIQDFLINGCDYVFIKPFTNNNLIQLINFFKINGFKSRENHKIILNNKQLIWEKI